MYAILAAFILATTITIPAAVVALIIAAASPAAVAVLTHAKASVATKRLVGAVVAVAVAFITERTTANGDAVITVDAIVTTVIGAVVMFATQQGSYAAILKKLRLNQWRITAPARGIGRPPS